MVHSPIGSLIYKKIKTMEQILIFVLGAISSLGLLGLGYAFIQALKMEKKTKNLENDIKDIYRRLDDIKFSIDKRTNEIENDLHGRVDETRSYIDSRFDKQSDRAGTIIAGVLEKTDKLDELFKIQMDQFAKVTLDHSDRIAELETSRKIEEDRIEQINS